MSSFQDNIDDRSYRCIDLQSKPEQIASLPEKKVHC